MKPRRLDLMLCSGTGCVSNRAFRIKEALDAELARHDLVDEVEVVLTGCNGFCQGPASGEADVHAAGRKSARAGDG
jgi:NADH:ubiquinone oxidoreductase subunit E